MSAFNEYDDNDDNEDEMEEMTPEKFLDDIKNQAYDNGTVEVSKEYKKRCGKVNDYQICEKELADLIEPSYEIILNHLNGNIGSDLVKLYFEFDMALNNTQQNKNETNLNELKNLKMKIDGKLTEFLTIIKRAFINYSKTLNTNFSYCKNKLEDPFFIQIYFNETNITKSNIIKTEYISYLYIFYHKLTKKSVYHRVKNSIFGTKGGNHTSKHKKDKNLKRKTVSKKKVRKVRK
jgi:hypothetical protein